MLTSATKPITARDFMELPEGPPYYQLIEGDLYMAPSPDLFHQDITGNIYFHIRLYLAKRVHVDRLGESAEEPAGIYGVRQNVESPLFPGLKISVSKIFQK